MVLAALLLQATTPQSAVEAERAFAAAAQARGQWTAFRETAAPDAVMFQPGPVKAQDWLKDRKDPAKAVEWWPTESYVSCDGKLAVNTGGWRRGDGSVGYFTTVWQRQADGGWKWIVDHGDVTKTPRERPAGPKILRASCEGKPSPSPLKANPGILDIQSSPDGTLRWLWFIWTHRERSVEANLWDGTRWVPVVNDVVMPAK